MSSGRAKALSFSVTFKVSSVLSAQWSVVLVVVNAKCHYGASRCEQLAQRFATHLLVRLSTALLRQLIRLVTLTQGLVKLTLLPLASGKVVVLRVLAISLVV